MRSIDQGLAEVTAALNDGWIQRSVIRRARLVSGLGKAGNSVAVKPLSTVLETDPDEDVRGLAAIALGRIGDPAAAPALRKALDEPTLIAQISVIFSLWLLRDRGSVPRLSERLLHSTSTEIRQFAADALGDIGDQDAVPALIDALDDPKACVRTAAAASLGMLGDARALDPLRSAHRSARGFSRRRMGRALERLEGRSRLTWRRRLRKRLLDTDKFIAIQMTLMASTQLASSAGKAINVKGRSQRELAGAIYRGRKLFTTGRHQEAFDFLERAVRQFPEDAEIRLLYASILLAYRIDDVAAEAAKAVELGPDNPVILVRAGHLLLGRGDREAARSCAARANELVQPDFVLMGGLDNLNGSLAVFAGEDELAEEKLRSAVEREPNDEPFVRDLAVFLAERGRLQDGVAVLDEGLKHVEKKDELERMRARMASEAAAS